MSNDQPLTVCPSCSCGDLFIRRDFPQRVGLFVVIVAAALFLFFASRRGTFYLGVIFLLAAVVIDALLYFFVGMVTVCYRCRAEFRDRPLNPDHGPFELAVAEKYRH